MTPLPSRERSTSLLRVCSRCSFSGWSVVAARHKRRAEMQAAVAAEPDADVHLHNIRTWDARLLPPYYQQWTSRFTPPRISASRSCCARFGSTKASGRSTWPNDLKNRSPSSQSTRQVSDGLISSNSTLWQRHWASRWQTSSAVGVRPTERRTTRSCVCARSLCRGLRLSRSYERRIGASGVARSSDAG